MAVIESGVFKERDWKQVFKDRRESAISSCHEIKQRATQNHTFAAPGEEQVPYEGGKDGGLRRRKHKLALMSINEIHNILATMSGRQVMSRFERRYIPRRDDVKRWAEPLSDWDRGVVDACHADQEESTAFRNGPGIAGLSWLRVEVDYLEDPDGMIVIEEVPIWNMLWPADEARKKNLVDRNWHIYGEWMDVDAVRELWPHKVNEIARAVHGSPEWDSSSGKQGSSRTPWEGGEGSSEGTLPVYDRDERKIWVEHYQRREVQVRFFVMVPRAGSYADAEAMIAQQQGTADLNTIFETQEFSAEDFKSFVQGWQESFGEEVPNYRYTKKGRWVPLYSYHIGDIVVEEGEVKINRFTYEAMTGYPYTQPEKVDWRSVTDALRTPQIWTNIFFTMLVKQMQVNPKGVLFAERGVFKNRNEGLRQFSSAGGFVEVERGKLSAGQHPPFLFHSGGQSPMGGFVQGMMGFAQEMIPKSAGFNPGALGQLGGDLRRISGTVVEHVREAAIASQGELYDSLALCRQRIGLILIAYLGEVLGMKHFKKIVGERPFNEEIIDPMTGEVAVDPQTQQPMTQPVEPPPDLFGDAVWSVAVEETRPAPDRTRFLWESLTESGALKVLVDSGTFTQEDIVELAPDIPEDKRKKMLERAKLQRSMMMQQQAQQPPAQPQAA